jgi:AcrR family transcriptional regulator
MTESKDIWIKVGYDLFALNGENELKVETLAKKAGISKSSFYHHFANMDIFITQLINFHLQQLKILIDKEKKVKSINPELINVLLEHKTDLLVNRQLRFNSQKEHYKPALRRSTELIGNGLIPVFVANLNQKLTEKQLTGLFDLALENFFLQLNPENLNATWLAAYFENLKRIATNFG